MKLTRYASVGLASAGLIGFVSIAFAAGMFPDYPVVGGATYCAGSSSSATGSTTSSTPGTITGCTNQVAAGPTIVTGNEQIPADTRLASGATPQTVLIGLASLNALPITVVTTGITAGLALNGTVTAAATSGGVLLVPTAALTGTTTIKLPAAPINGQQFAIASTLGLTTLVVTSANGISAVNNSPTALTVSATAAFNYRLMYNTAADTWYRLQ